MTPTEFWEIRCELGLSADKMAALIGVSSGRVIRKWEAGENAIPGPAARLVRVILLARANGWDLSPVM